MAGLSQSFIEEYIAFMFGAVGSPKTAPANYYAALFTAPPDNQGAFGAECVIGSGAYARVAILNNNTNFVVAGVGLVRNGPPITFPTCTSPWGTVVGVGLYINATSSIAANFKGYCPLPDPIAVAINDIPTIGSGKLEFALTSTASAFI